MALAPQPVSTHATIQVQMHAPDDMVELLFERCHGVLAQLHVHKRGSQHGRIRRSMTPEMAATS